MKIVHIITGLDKGGAEKALFKILKSMCNSYSFEIICLGKQGYYSKEINDLNIPIYYLNLKYKPFSFFFGLIKTYKLLKEINPDIVQTWMYHADLIGGIASKISNVKKIYWTIVTSNTKISFLGIKTFLILCICALLSYLVPTKIICVANTAIVSHKKMLYKSNTFIFIPIGFEKNLYSKKITNSLDLKLIIKNKINGNLILGHIARWHPNKNQKLLIELLSVLQNKKINFFCVMIGNNFNSHNTELKNLLIKFEINKKNILLIDEVKSIDLFIQQFDLFILTSLGEGMPNVIGEAMSNSIPCIASNVGDCKNLIGDTGWIFESNDINQLVSSVEKAIKLKSDKEKWIKKKNECQNRLFKNYSINNMKYKYDKLWNA